MAVILALGVESRELEVHGQPGINEMMPQNKVKQSRTDIKAE